MKYTLIALFLFSLSAFADGTGNTTNVPSTMSGTEVYPNSGPTDANHDTSGMDTPSSDRSGYGPDVPEQKMKDKKTMKKVDKKTF